MSSPPPYPRTLPWPDGSSVTFDDALMTLALKGKDDPVCRYVTPVWMPSKDACCATIGDRHEGLADYRICRANTRGARGGQVHLWGSTRGPVRAHGFGWQDIVAVMWPAGHGGGWWLAVL